MPPQQPGFGPATIQRRCGGRARKGSVIYSHGLMVDGMPSPPEGVEYGEPGDARHVTDGSVWLKSGPSGGTTGWHATHAGMGSPEGVVDGSFGDVFIRKDDGLGIQRYEKFTASGNTGWVGLPPELAAFGNTESVAQAIPLTPVAISFDDASALQFGIVTYDSGTKIFTMQRDMIVKVVVHVGTELTSGNNRFAHFNVEVNGTPIAGATIRLFMTSTTSADTGTSNVAGVVSVGDEVQINGVGDSVNTQTIPEAMSCVFQLIGDAPAGGMAAGRVFADIHDP